MKRLLITLSAFCILFADISDDLVGQWKLSGLKVDYLHIARATTEIKATAVVNEDIEITLNTIPAGALYNVFQNGPFTLGIIDAVNLNLNVNLWPDGTGYIAEGSFYPDIDLVGDSCVTEAQIFPVTDEFVWELGEAGTFSDENIIGGPSANALAGGGTGVYGFGVAQSGTFDGWPSVALPERVPAGLAGIAQSKNDGTTEYLALGCSGWCAGGGADALSAGSQAQGGPAVDLAGCIAACSGWDYQTAQAYGSPGWLTGSGSSGSIAVDQGLSQMPGNVYYQGDNAGDPVPVDLQLEWNAIDGVTSQSGIDIDDEDGDGDATEFNRIFGLPYISSTYLVNSKMCDITGGDGLTKPLAGDVIAEIGGATCGEAFNNGELGGLTESQCDDAALAGFIKQGCLSTVTPIATGLCLAADGDDDEATNNGTPAQAVAGLCLGAAQADDDEDGVADLLVTCQDYGVSNTVIGACSALGFDADVCADAGGVAVAGIADACEDGVIAGATATCQGYESVDTTGGDGLFVVLYAGCLGDCFDPTGQNDTCGAQAHGACAATAGQGVGMYGDCATWAAATYDGATCADAGTTDCAVLVSDAFATEMCTFIGTTLTCASVQASCDEGDDDCVESSDGLSGTASADCDCAYWAGTVADGFGAQSEATGYQSCTDYGNNFKEDCLVVNPLGDAQHDGGNTAPAMEFYVLNFDLANWGYLLTANAAAYPSYLAQFQGDVTALAGAIANGDVPNVLANDATYDFVTDQNDPLYGTGRLVMEYEPTCIDEIEARQIVAEFVGLDELCAGTGDATGDGLVDVQDIVRIVGHILGSDNLGPATSDTNGDGAITSQDQPGPPDGVPDLLGGYGRCNADTNADGIINVTDIISIVSTVLGTKTADMQDATEASILVAGNEVSIAADGYVGGVQMLVEHTEDLEIEFSNNFYVGGIEPKGDNTSLILFVGSASVTDVFTVTQGKVTSILESTISGMEEILNVTVEQPADYVISNAYPNPFNPSTTISLELNTSADLSVKVYNLMGQLVDVVAEGSYSPNTYNWTWNAENLASGVYFIKTQVGSDVSAQKVMLLK